MCTLPYFFFASRGRAILPEKRRLRKIIMYERKKTYFWEAVRPTVPARYHTSSDRNMRSRYSGTQGSGNPSFQDSEDSFKKNNKNIRDRDRERGS